MEPLSDHFRLPIQKGKRVGNFSNSLISAAILRMSFKVILIRNTFALGFVLFL